MPTPVRRGPSVWPSLLLNGALRVRAMQVSLAQCKGIMNWPSQSFWNRDHQPTFLPVLLLLLLRGRWRGTVSTTVITPHRRCDAWSHIMLLWSRRENIPLTGILYLINTNESTGLGEWFVFVCGCQYWLAVHDHLIITCRQPWWRLSPTYPGSSIGTISKNLGHGIMGSCSWNCNFNV